MAKRFMGSILALTIMAAMTVPAGAAGETKPKKEPSAAQLAARERMSKCSAEWKDAKAAGKVETGIKWPKYWSACNKRLKGTNA